jgi:RTX calcium-binding nonapeptide repeat (4 copies)
VAHNLAPLPCGSGGGNGNDMLSGTDVLFGQNGDDTLNGKEGIDLLCGGSGDDTLAGGADADSFTAARAQISRPTTTRALERNASRR